MTALRIEWPSGTVQELMNVPANQILTITEPARWVPLGLRELRSGKVQGVPLAAVKRKIEQGFAS